MSSSDILPFYSSPFLLFFFSAPLLSCLFSFLPAGQGSAQPTCFLSLLLVYDIISTHFPPIKIIISLHQVEMVTYEPNHGTFEMDIMRIMGIKEDRVAKKTYWY